MIMLLQYFFLIPLHSGQAVSRKSPKVAKSRFPSDSMAGFTEIRI